MPRNSVPVNILLGDELFRGGKCTIVGDGQQSLKPPRNLGFTLHDYLVMWSREKHADFCILKARTTKACNTKVGG